MTVQTCLERTHPLAVDHTHEFENLLREHEQAVLRVAWRMLGRREDAEDAAQEVFLRLHRHLRNLDTRNLRGWLYQTTVSVCCDALRRKRPQELITETATAGQQDERLLETERSRLLHEALLRLPERERAAVILREIEEFSTEETARLMGVSAVTVRTQIASARRKLKDWIAERMKR